MYRYICVTPSHRRPLTDGVNCHVHISGHIATRRAGAYHYFFEQHLHDPSAEQFAERVYIVSNTGFLRVTHRVRFAQ